MTQQHTHEHPHAGTEPDHAHASGHAAQSGVHTGYVVLDIGEDTGGLIVYTSPERHRDEIEISPKGHDTKRAHTDVAERRMADRTLYVAVYLPMPAGVYILWGPDPAHPTEVTVKAGTVTEVDWR